LTLKEALESGKPYRRAGGGGWLEAPLEDWTTDDVLADWEVKLREWGPSTYYLCNGFGRVPHHKDDQCGNYDCRPVRVRIIEVLP
jgi:hypothetical protein